MTFTDNLNRAAAAAVCNFLSNGGNQAAAHFIVRGLLTPGSQVPAAAAGLGLLALNYGCAYDPNKITKPISLQSCFQADGNGFNIDIYGDAGTRIDGFNSVRSGFIWPAGLTPGGNRQWTIDLYMVNGFHYVGNPAANNSWLVIRSSLPAGSKCISSAPQGAGNPISHTTYQHTDTVCNINVEHLAWYVETDNTIRPVLKMSSPLVPYASGGVISGCNFNPVVYVGGGGGGSEPPHVFPWVDGPNGPDGAPWWLGAVLQGAVAGVTGAVVGAALKALFPETLPATVYRLRSVCETAPDGSPLDRAVEKAIPQLRFGEGIDARLGALVDIAQGLKDFKQPTCGHVRKTGRVISVRFRSVEKSPFSDRIKRKGLAYRDQGGAPLEAHSAHWADFSWRAGPVQVVSTGLAWGEPQVWAETEAEGRRVLAHAAAISGINLADPQHRWRVGHSSVAGFGLVLTMRTDRDAAGHIWVAERAGSHGLPQVAAV